jgi:septal ring factor EnvC (AmiA/AmiB activator)
MVVCVFVVTSASIRLLEARREWDALNGSQLTRLQQELAAQHAEEHKQLKERIKSLEDQNKRLTAELAKAATDSNKMRSEIVTLIDRIKVVQESSSWELKAVKDRTVILEVCGGLRCGLFRAMG